MVFRDIDKKALIDNAATVVSKITIVGTDIVFTENDYISEWEYEDFRYVPENGFIGQFVERLFDGKLKDLPTDINIENKEISLQVGIVNGITGETTYYDYGNFIITKPGEEDTTGITSFESADYAKKFNATYTDNINYPCLALELANNACSQANVPLDVKGDAYCFAVKNEGLVAGEYSFLINGIYYNFSTTKDLKLYDSLLFILDENRIIQKNVNDDFTLTRTDIKPTSSSSMSGTLLKGSLVGYNDFINNDFVIENNQFEETDTLRDVMKAIAKLGYTWVRVGTDNKVHLDFKKKTTSTYGLTIEGKSVQDGTPTPDAPVEIESVEGVTSLFDKDSETKSLHYSTATGSENTSASSWSQFNFIEAKPNVSYTLSSTYLESNSSFEITQFDSSNNWIKSIQLSLTNGSYTFTTESTTKYIRIGARNDRGVELNIQLEEGTIVHKYVPYGRWLEQKTTGKNLFNKDKITKVRYFTSNGSLGQSVDWAISDYIDVIGGTNYTYQGLTDVGASPYSCYYDKDKKFISSFKQAIGVNTITIPNNAYYVRFSVKTSVSDENTFQFEKGTATPYEPYKENTALIDLNKKNLFDKENPNVVNLYPGATNFVSNANYKSLYIGIKPNTTYTIYRSVSVSQDIVVGSSVNIPVVDGVVTTRKASSVNVPITITTGEEDNYLTVYYNWSGADNEEVRNSIKIYEGVETDDYYRLASIGDVKDTFKDGVLTQRIGKVVLDNAGNWYVNGNHYQLTFYTNLDVLKGKIPMSNYFKGVLYSSNELGISLTQSDNISYLRINNASSVFSSLSEFTTWLSENSVEVYYELATPIKYNINYEKLSLFDSVNNISFNDDIIDDSNYILVEDNITIDDYYETEKQPNIYGPVNKVLLGMSQIDGENVYNAKLADEIESIEIEGKSYQEVSTVKDGDNIFDFAKWYKNRNSIRQSATWDETSFSFENTGTSEVITVTPPMNNNDLSNNKVFIDIAGFEIESSTDYTFSCSNPNLVKTEILIFFYDKDYNYLSLLQGLGGSHSRLSASFTTPSNAKYICFRFDNEARNVAPTNLKITEIALKKGADSTYTPFVSNSPSPDYPSEIRSVEGVTNLLDTRNLTEQTINGVTFTPVYNEGHLQYVNVNGTASARVFYSLNKGILPSGTYRTTGCPSGGANNTYAIFNYSNSKNDTGNGEVCSANYNLAIFIESGYTANNLEFKPMISSDTTLTYNDYVPYGRWLEQKTVGSNILNNQNYELGSIDNNGGIYGTTINYRFPEYTSVIGGKKIYLSKALCIYWYDKNKTIISYDFTAELEFTAPTNAKYMRFRTFQADFETFNNEDCMVSYEPISKYEPYKENTALIDLNKKNLKDDATKLNCTVDTSKNVVVANNNLKSLYVKVEPNTTYTIYKTTENTFRVTTSTEEPIVGASIINSFTNHGADTITLTTEENANYLLITYYNSGNYVLTEEEIYNSIKIYKGVETDDYYRIASVPQTKDNFKDGVLTQRVKEKMLGGGEYYTLDQSGGYYRACITLDDIYKYTDSTRHSGKINCSHFKVNTNNGYGHVFHYQNGLFFILPEGMTTLDQWKAYLQEQYSAGTPLTIQYELATPIEHILDYEILELHKGYNNITLNDALEPNMDIIVSDIDNNLTTYSGNPILANLSDNIETSLQIWDNPLTYTENLRKIALNGSESLFGVRYTPMNINTVGHPWLEGDDYVKLTNLSEQTVYTYPFDRKLSYRGYIKSDISSTALTSVQQEYEFNGDINNRLSKTEISVDKANKEISLLSAEVEDTMENIATININTTNIEQQVTNLSTDLNNATTEIKESLSNYATENEVVQLRQEVATNQSSTALQINVINEALENGVSKVKTEKGFTFDDSGLTINDSNSDIASNLDNEGLQIYDKTGSTESELLYAGIDTDTNEAVVRTKNLSVSQYFVMGSNSRFEDFEDEDGEEGTGVFFIG